VAEDAAVVLQGLVTELRAARRGLRLTQKELGDALGVSGLAIGSWETGKDVAGLGNLVRWARAVGFTVGVDGAASRAVLVPRRDEQWADFHIRCLMVALAGAREGLYRSQEMVGDAVGVTAWTVHMWETAHRVPRVLRLITWCQYLDVRLVLEAVDGPSG
jgi:DNA-binding XRE family transcriptional regulator